MTALKKAVLVLLLLLNAAVLLGQVWPEGAPPFASSVNITFLCLSMLAFLYLLIRKSR